MKIIGIGVDIIEISRIERAAEREAFCRYVFTPDEMDYCSGRGRQKSASLAARWAAKEAVLKALGSGLVGKMKLQEIEVLPANFKSGGLNDSGRPCAELTGEVLNYAKTLGVKEVFISLSHGRETAVAQCVLVG